MTVMSAYLFPYDNAVDEGREEAGYIGDGVGNSHKGSGIVGAEVADVDHVAGDLARRQGGRHHHRCDRLLARRKSSHGLDTWVSKWNLREDALRAI